MRVQSDSTLRSPAVATPALDCDFPQSRRLRLSGGRYEIGYQHGVAQRAAIRRFLDDRVTRLATVMSAERLASAISSIPKYMGVIAETLPGMAEEIAGLADGAQIRIEDAYLLQLRRELAGYQSVRSRGDCTTFCRLAAEHTVLGQTIDLNGDMSGEIVAIDLAHRDGRRLALVSFTGLLGYVGMNDSGLCVGLNLVLGGEWRCGIPGYMAIRHLLDEASNVDDAIALLRRLPLASSRTLVLCDGRKLAVVEYVLDEISVIETRECVHTNHFLHPCFTERDELNPFARTSSLRRLDACAAHLNRLAVDAEVEAYFRFLEAPPIYVAPNGDIRRECTVGTVVMQPRRRAVYAKAAPPPSHRTTFLGREQSGRA